VLLEVCHLRKGVRVWFRSKIVYYSPHKFIPLSLVVLPEVVSYLNDEFVYFFNTAIDVAFLGVGDRSELVLFFNHFGEIPKFRRSTHVFSFERVIEGLQILEMLCS